MTLINTNGMALIGPGSEWFWTAVSGLILAVTFIAIYRQLRLQASTRAWDQLDMYAREGDTERIHAASIEILTALREGVDPARIPDMPARVIGGVWEKYALLARRGHLNIKLLWQFDSEGPEGWWLLLKPRTMRRREETGDSTILEHLEWLAGRMVDLDRRGGLHVLAQDDVTERLDVWIESHREEVRAARARRTIIVESANGLVRDDPAPVMAAAEG